MTAQPTIQSIPLNLLQLSSLNARKTGGDNVDDLVASIAADGLLQNLTVITGKKGKFDVVAGGRRLRALQALAKDKCITIDHDVPCRVIDAESAMEASTAENTIREQMNPADEIAVYAKLIKSKKTVTDIAVRFGQSERHVNGMLRLGSVSPVLLEDLRNGEIRLDQVKAFSITDDHSLQEQVWREVGRSDWDNDPDDIRHALTKGDLDSTSRLAKYITIEAYEAAGGAMRRDLFGDAAFFVDRELAEQLALAKLERRAATERKKGYGWVECRTDLPYTATDRMQRVHNPSDEEKAIAGMFVTIGHDGKAEVKGPYIRTGDRQRVEQGEAIPQTAAEAKANKAPPKDDLSQPQIMRLKGERTAIARIQLASNPRFMLTALAASLAAAILGDRMIGDGMVKIDTRHSNTNPDFAAALNADTHGASAGDEWQTTIGDITSAMEIQQWLLAQPEQITSALLTYLAAQMIVLDDSTEDDAAYLTLAGIDMAANWTPQVDWLASLAKPTVLRIVRAVLGDDIAEPLANLKKAALAERSAHLLQSTGYLPVPLRPAGFDALWAAAAP